MTYLLWLKSYSELKLTTDRQTEKQEAQRATIVHLSTSFWNRDDADNDLPKKDKLARGFWVLASSQDSLNSIAQLQRSKKYLSQSEAGVAVLDFL